tara:strand:+ start:1366 stop:2310 length:945 start_codon:yes stop_codon:yes gene_type:complete
MYGLMPEGSSRYLKTQFILEQGLLSPDEIELSPKLVDKTYTWQLSIRYLYHMMCGQMGQSFYHSQAVYPLVWQKCLTSIKLVTAALMLLYLSAILLSFWRSQYLSSSAKRISEWLLLPISVLPSSLIAICLINAFASVDGFSQLPLHPLPHHELKQGFFTPFYQRFVEYILPLSLIVLPRLLPLCHLIEKQIQHESLQPYYFAARIRGLSPHNLFFYHLLPNLSITLLAHFPSLFLKLLFSSTLLCELLFNIDGMGSLVFQSAISHDYPTLLCIIHLSASVSLVIYLLVDIAYSLCDPRISYTQKSHTYASPKS